MKKFLLKIILVLSLFLVLNLALLFLVPLDKNAYLYEYNDKVTLLETVEQPRIIFVGGSNLTFGIDSKTIQDSLEINVINFGLHAGVGIRYMLDNCLHYVKQGDIVVVQMEYSNFFETSNGEPETLAPLMMANGWQNFWEMNAEQKKNAIKGLPQVGFGNIKRCLSYLKTQKWDSAPSGSKFEYRRSGFNDYGDEVSHYKYKHEQLAVSNSQVQGGEIDADFVRWLKNTLKQYEQKGVKVVMMPPLCTHSIYLLKYRDDIGQCLSSIGYSYVVSPNELALDDSFSFGGGYHLTYQGVVQGTALIIEYLKPILASAF